MGLIAIFNDMDKYFKVIGWIFTVLSVAIMVVHIPYMVGIPNDNDTPSPPQIPINTPSNTNDTQTATEDALSPVSSPELLPPQIPPAMFPQRADITTGEVITFGSRYWRVLDIDEQNGKVLLFSDEIIMRRPLHMLDGERTWESSALRLYLNGDFLNTFTLDEQELIMEVRNINHDNPWIQGDSLNDTNDRIFLLSINDVLKYFGDSGHIGNRSGSTINDQFNEMRIAYYSDVRTVWALRSPGFHNQGLAFINTNGWIQGFGLGFFSDSVSIRPALWLQVK